jgi:adenosine kinase
MHAARLHSFKPNFANVNLSSSCATVFPALLCSPLAFNLSARYVCTEHKDAMRQIYEHADVVFGNRTEVRAFAIAQRLPADSVVEIARLMAALPKVNGSRGRIVVVTNGDQPAVVAENGTVRR